MDAAREYTDREIRRAARDLAMDYGREGDAAASKVMDFLTERAVDGVVPESALQGRDWARLRSEVARQMSDRNRASAEAIGGRMGAVRDLTAEGADPSSKVPRPAIDRRRDLTWNERHVEAAARASVGKDPEVAAKGVRGLADMNRNAAVRKARTAINGAENAGRMDAMLARGGSKRWVAVMDERTRVSHASINGEVVPVDEPFSNGLMYPGDPSGPPEEVYNCRCTMEWVAPEAAQEWQPEDIGTAPQRPRQEDFSSYDEYLEARSAYRQARRDFADRKEALIEEIAARPAHGFETEAAVREWADRVGVEVTDGVFRSIDPRVLDDAVYTLDSLMAKYPQVAESFTKLGSKFRISVSDDRSVFMEAHGGLAVNPSMASTYRDAVERVVEGYTNVTRNDAVGRDLLWQVRGEGTLRTVVTHEFGHNLDSAIRDDLSVDQIAEYHRELAGLTRAHTVSDYSTVNTDEAFAEGFAEYTCNPGSEYAKAFGEFLRRWL